MDDAAFSGRHRRKFVRYATLADSFGSDIGGHSELLKPHGAVIHTVEADLFVLIAGKAKHFDR